MAELLAMYDRKHERLWWKITALEEGAYLFCGLSGSVTVILYLHGCTCTLDTSGQEINTFMLCDSYRMQSMKVEFQRCRLDKNRNFCRVMSSSYHRPSHLRKGCPNSKWILNVPIVPNSSLWDRLFRYCSPVDEKNRDTILFGILHKIFDLRTTPGINLWKMHTVYYWISGGNQQDSIDV